MVMPAKALALTAVLLCAVQAAFGQTATDLKIDAIQRQLDQLKFEREAAVGHPVSHSTSSSDPVLGAPAPPLSSSLTPAAPPSNSLPSTAPSAPVATKEKTYPDFKLTGFFSWTPPILDSRLRASPPWAISRTEQASDARGWQPLVMSRNAHPI